MKKVLVIGLSGESVFLNIKHFNNDGETIKVKDKFVEPGGKGFNQAITLGSLGANVSFITTFGNNGYKEECMKVLNRYNVKIYEITKDCAGSYAVITVDENGNNNVMVYEGASKDVTFDDVLFYKNALDKADIYLLQLEYPSEVITEVIRYGFEHRKEIILNPAPMNNLKYDILNMVNIIIPNKYENSFIDINKIDNPEIICTLGQEGVMYHSQTKSKKYDAKKVDAVDTTGAGDVFNASLVFSLASGKTIDESIRFAICASAIKVTRKGICEAIPSLEEVRKFMEERRL